MAKPERTTPYFSSTCRNIISLLSGEYNTHDKIWFCFFLPLPLSKCIQGLNKAEDYQLYKWSYLNLSSKNTLVLVDRILVPTV